jgi:hypothetical protein
MFGFLSIELQPAAVIAAVCARAKTKCSCLDSRANHSLFTPEL